MREIGAPSDRQDTRRAALESGRSRHIVSLILLTASLPGWVVAQGSPLLAGSTSYRETLLEWFTPLAILLVMLLGGDRPGRGEFRGSGFFGAVLGAAIAFVLPAVIV